jgi:RNA chaperone Hfq
VFLNYVRREKLTVTIRMMDGSELEGRIRNCDRFALVLDQIKTPKAVSNYFSHQ